MSKKLLVKTPQTAVFSAAPHGVSAALIDALLKATAAAGTRPTRRRYLRGLSATARRKPMRRCTNTRTGRRGGSPNLRVPFRASAEARDPARGASGCFATATLLASVPLARPRARAPARLFVSGVTGSTGAGRKPIEGTHHPVRHSDLYSYNALSHRHAPEITACARLASGVEADFAFRAAFGTVRPWHSCHGAGVPEDRRSTRRVCWRLCATFMRIRPFVRVREQAPRVKEIAASNYAHLVRGGQRSHRRCDVCGRQSQQRRRRRRSAMDEPDIRLAGDLGLTAPAPGWT